MQYLQIDVMLGAVPRSTPVPHLFQTKQSIWQILTLYNYTALGTSKSKPAAKDPLDQAASERPRRASGFDLVAASEEPKALNPES